jgi:hypothetical protein
MVTPYEAFDHIVSFEHYALSLNLKQFFHVGSNPNISEQSGACGACHFPTGIVGPHVCLAFIPVLHVILGEKPLVVIEWLCKGLYLLGLFCAGFRLFFLRFLFRL